MGAVAPKLLYETGKFSTPDWSWACAAWREPPFINARRIRPSISIWPNLCATWLRLSAACLAMRRDDFFRVGGFDAVNTPIAHSDIDLCFKVREAGLRCVYTPYRDAESCRSCFDRRSRNRRKRPRSAGTRRRFICSNAGRATPLTIPYFTDNMRDWLYSDSPTPIRMMARDQPASRRIVTRSAFCFARPLLVGRADDAFSRGAAGASSNGIFVAGHGAAKMGRCGRN